MSYKILSLDGGGTWALIQASILQDLYGDINGHEILKKFDMVIANSGGSLVLAALCNDMKPSKIVAVFRNESERGKIFSRLKFYERNLLSQIRSLFKNFAVGSKYHTERKKQGLIEVLQQHDHRFQSGILPSIVKTPLSKLPKIIGKEDLQLIIIGFDYFKERVSFFRSNEKSKTDKFSSKFYDISLGDAIHASGNAPVNYFDEYAKVNMKHKVREEIKEEKINWYWDGAVAGFNNPVLAGLIEAMTNFEDKPLNDFKILSIGTGQKGKAIIVDHKYSEGNFTINEIYEKNKNKPYVLSDDSRKFKLEIGKLAQSILSDPPDSATFIAYSILNRKLQNNANLVRINPCITPELNKQTNEYILPEVFRNEPERFKSVLEMDMDATEDEQVDLIVEVVAKFIVNEEGRSCLPNQFIRGDSSDKFKLGHATYREAKKRWKEIEGG
jgi:patatin-like phospholipase/acyl hydrolase